MDDSPRGHALDALALDTLLTPARAPGPLLHLHVGHLGARPAPAPVDEAAASTRSSCRPGARRTKQRVLEAASADLRTVVVRPGIVYGGSRGIVGDLFKAAANGLVRVIGTGENHWPLVYDRDLGELYLMLAAERRRRRACSMPTTNATSRSTTS